MCISMTFCYKLCYSKLTTAYLSSKWFDAVMGLQSLYSVLCLYWDNRAINKITTKSIHFPKKQQSDKAPIEVGLLASRRPPESQSTTQLSISHTDSSGMQAPSEEEECHSVSLLFSFSTICPQLFTIQFAHSAVPPLWAQKDVVGMWN